MNLFQKTFAGLAAFAVTLGVAVVPASAATTFNDDSSIPTWAQGAVQALADEAIISGYEDGSFHPNDTVTRAQFAKIIVLAADGITIDEDSTSSFSDVEGDFWGVKYIEAAKTAGIVNGNADGTFAPNAAVNRAAAAKMISLAFGISMDKAEGAPHFADVPANEWFYDYVEAVYNYSIVGGYDNGNFGPNDALTRAQAAAMIQGKSDESGALVADAPSARNPIVR
ncbi:MAG: S-layer homology domain-containing protein, partial [Patescibacteria group bacterium]|nr:S-layer homology domain-containing protein [Patescibacteria group bacterium]